MAYIAIDANVPGTMTAHAPSHVLINLSFYLVHLANLAVAGNTIDVCLDVGFVGEEYIGRSWNPIDPDPGWLFSTVKECRQFLDLGFISRDHLVTLHALGDIRDSGV
jgi:hypothetical protein